MEKPSSRGVLNRFVPRPVGDRGGGPPRRAHHGARNAGRTQPAIGHAPGAALLVEPDGLPYVPGAAKQSREWETAMAGSIEQRLAELGIELPAPAAAAANYVPVRRSGDLLVVSGQLPIEAGAVRYKGKLGGGVSLEDGQAAARLCAVNILAQVKAACGGDLERIAACLRLGGFVACTPEFTDHPKVINGASDLLVEVLGEAGHHARAAVGVSSLPFDAAVEVDGMFELR
jgi:enamine deaminase RidA (YjgF/YER057c/UK114 family)